MQAINRLFERSKEGISFKGETREQAAGILNNMFEKDAFGRLISLLELLQLLANSEEYHSLNANGFMLEVDAKDHERMQTLYAYVEKNFQEQISLEEIAREINMTEPAFCRYFKKLTGKTFIQFVNEFRVAHACSLLGQDHLSIAAVSFESGFNNLSHFNKQFKKITNQSPREYRKSARKILKPATV